MNNYKFHGNSYPYSEQSIERFLRQNRNQILRNIKYNNIDQSNYSKWVNNVFKYNVNKINFFDESPYGNFSNILKILYDNASYILDKYLMDYYIRPLFFRTIGSSLVGAPIFVVNSFNSVGSIASCVNTEFNYLLKNNLYTGQNLNKAINYCSRAHLIELFGLNTTNVLPTMTIAESIYLAQLRQEKLYEEEKYSSSFNENFDYYILIPLGYINHIVSEIIGTAYDLTTKPLYYISQGLYNYYIDYIKNNIKNKDEINRFDYVMTQIEEQEKIRSLENRCLVNWDRINEEESRIQRYNFHNSIKYRINNSLDNDDLSGEHDVNNNILNNLKKDLEEIIKITSVGDILYQIKLIAEMIKDLIEHDIKYFKGHDRNLHDLCFDSTLGNIVNYTRCGRSYSMAYTFYEMYIKQVIDEELLILFLIEL